MRRDSNCAWRRTAGRGLTACLTALGLLAGSAAAQDDSAKIVTHNAQGYSVDAAESNIVQVLTEVGQQAGFSVEAPENFSSPLTLSLQDVPLDQVLRRVLRNENYIIVYRGGVQKAAISGEKIDKIFLLSSAAPGQPPKPPAAAGGSPLAGPAAAGQHGGPHARNAPPPPPPPPPPGEDDEGGDIAARSARARARAEARRAALGDGPAATTGAMGAMGTAAAMPGAAHMVQSPEDFTPPPIEEPGHGAGDVPAVDVPPDGEEVPDEQ